MGNKGFEAALAAVEMASLTQGIRGQGAGARKSGSGLRASGLGRKQVPRSARNDKTGSHRKKKKRT
jgi:hypothetical protein